MRGPIFISRNLLLVISFASLTLPLGACGEQETATVGQTFGPSPALPEPETSVFPTVNIANRWSAMISTSPIPMRS